MNKNILITIVLIIVVGAAGFYGGMQYQKSQRPALGQFGQGRGQFGRRLGANGAAVRGQITSMDSGSITVKLPDGSSKIVTISNTTTINKAVTGSKTDLTTGSPVMVFGTTNSDGSVTAQAIQLNAGMPGFRGAGNSPQSTQ